jgi:N-acetylmuramoyl-L-alanine amidase
MEHERAVVIIDPGHGGDSSAGKSSAYGARGPSGLLEKDVALALAGVIARDFGPGAALTRQDDRNLSLASRCEIARHGGAAVFLSIHAGANHAGAYGGPDRARAFAHVRASDPSQALARNVAGALGAWGGSADHGDLAVLAPEHHAAHTAACLVEVPSLGDAGGEARLRDPVEVTRLGRAIAAGIRNYCAAAGVPHRSARAFGIAQRLPNLTFGPSGPGGRPAGAVTFGSTPVAFNPVQIMWIDYNESDTPAGSYYDEVWVTDVTGRTVWSDQVYVENGLAAGGSQPHYVVWTPPNTGIYTAHVRLNTSSGHFAIPEDSVDDNESSVTATAAGYMPMELSAGAGYGRGTVSRVSNDPPRAGRREEPRSDFNNWDGLTYQHYPVPNNEITFDFSAAQYNNDPVDAEVTVVLSSAADGTRLGQGSVSVTSGQRGYVTFTGSASDPIDQACRIEITAYNRINPQATVSFNVSFWT